MHDAKVTEVKSERPGQDLNLRSLPGSGFRDRRDTGLRDLGSDLPSTETSLLIHRRHRASVRPTDI